MHMFVCVLCYRYFSVIMDGAVLFDHHENEVLGFNSIMSNICVDDSFLKS